MSTRASSTSMALLSGTDELRRRIHLGDWSTPPRPTLDDAARRPRGVKVLLVDSCVDTTDLLSELLGLLGHDVQAANSAAAALALQETFRPDVAVLELRLPRMDGFELAARMRQVSPPLHLVALTSQARPADRERTQAAGFDVHLEKPFGVEKLTRLLALG